LGGNIRWGRPFGLEAELEMADDLIYGFRIFDKRDDSHLASTGRTKQRIHFVDLADHLGPAFGEPKRLLLLDDRRVRRRDYVFAIRIYSCLVALIKIGFPPEPSSCPNTTSRSLSPSMSLHPMANALKLPNGFSKKVKFPFPSFNHN